MVKDSLCVQKALAAAGSQSQAALEPSSLFGCVVALHPHPGAESPPPALPVKPYGK